MIGGNRINPRGLSEHTFAWHHTPSISTEISVTYAWLKWHSSGGINLRRAALKQRDRRASWWRSRPGAARRCECAISADLDADDCVRPTDCGRAELVVLTV